MSPFIEPSGIEVIMHHKYPETENLTTRELHASPVAQAVNYAVRKYAAQDLQTKRQQTPNRFVYQTK